MINNVIRSIDLNKIKIDENQPRKTFPIKDLEDLALSIKENGLLQPITVRKEDDGFIIVTGERRFRAHQIAGIEKIKAQVMTVDNVIDLRAIQLIENSQRADVSPLEEGKAYQAILSESGMNVDELATKLGMKQAWRINERLSLLNLTAEFQEFFAKNLISASQAFEMSKLSPDGQKKLWTAIKAGKCQTYNLMRSAALAIKASEGQCALFADSEIETSKERMAAKGMEDLLKQFSCDLARVHGENGDVKFNSVDIDQLSKIADLAKVLASTLKQIETKARAAEIIRIAS